MTRALGTVLVLTALAGAAPLAGAEKTPAAGPVAPWKLPAPAYVDVSAARDWKLPDGRAAVALATLPADEARAVLAAPPAGDEAPTQLRNREPLDPLPVAETQAIGTEGAAVRRTGKRLVVTPASGRPLLFENVTLPGTRNADPDGTTYTFAGRLGKGRHLQVRAAFQHDSPGSYVVNAASGRTAFLHEFDDDVFLSPDDGKALVYNALNGPFTLVVLSLDAAGPAPELVCRVGGKGRATAETKGWRSSTEADVVLVRGERTSPERVPMRLERKADGWQVAVPEPARLEGPDGLACFTGR